MGLVINIIFSFIEFLSGLSLANVLFRLPIESNKKFKQILISLFLACESAYFNAYWNNPLISFSFTLILWIISLVVVFKISIWYSTLIGVVSALLGGGLEAIGYLIGNLIASINLYELNEVTRNIVLLAVSVVLYILSLILYRTKLGFHIPNIYSKPPLNKLFFIVSSVLITSLLILVLSAFLFTGNIGMIHIIITLSLLICIFFVVYFSYKYNKKILADKYKRGTPWT